jgi:3-methyl-2-oxobutanoate hydroxymethyltransferase
MLGMYEGPTPRFVKRYADLSETIGDAVARYAAEVRAGAFPEDEHTYRIRAEELAAFEAALKT